MFKLANILSRVIVGIFTLLGLVIVMRAMMFSLIVGTFLFIVMIPLMWSLMLTDRRIKKQLNNKLKQGE